MALSDAAEFFYGVNVDHRTLIQQPTATAALAFVDVALFRSFFICVSIGSRRNTNGQN